MAEHVIKKTEKFFGTPVNCQIEQDGRFSVNASQTMPLKAIGSGIPDIVARVLDGNPDAQVEISFKNGGTETKIKLNQLKEGFVREDVSTIGKGGKGAAEKAMFDAGDEIFKSAVRMPKIDQRLLKRPSEDAES